jgi:hypothetical protein
VWQELRHTNLAELARQAPHLLRPSNGASSAKDTSGGGDPAAAGSRTSIGERDSSARRQASTDKSTRSAGSSGQQSSMHDAARSRLVVEAMQLSPEQRAAFAKVLPDSVVTDSMTSPKHCSAVSALRWPLTMGIALQP